MVMPVRWVIDRRAGPRARGDKRGLGGDGRQRDAREGIRWE